MKINVVSALAGGLIIGAGAMVPLGSFAQSETPALSPTSSTEETAAPTDLTTEAPVVVTPEPTPAVPLTPPSFGPGDKTDDDDDDVEYEDDDDEDEDEYEDEDDDEDEDEYEDEDDD